VSGSAGLTLLAMTRTSASSSFGFRSLHLFNLEHIRRAVLVGDHSSHLWFFVSARCAGEYESESG
jgi:hypothetical protein